MEGTTGVAWRMVADSLIAGIAHDLNGRLTALAGVAHLARSPHAGQAELAGILDDQAARLAESIRMLRILPVAPPAQPQLVRLGDVLTEVAVLYRVRSGPEPPLLHVAGDNGVVVNVPPNTLAEAVLLLLAATEPRTATRGGAITVRYGVDGAMAYLRLEAGVGANAAIASPRWPDPAQAALEARAAVERMGGRVLNSGAASQPTWYEMRLPAVMS